MKRPFDPASPTTLMADIARISRGKIRREGDRLGLKLGFRHVLFQLSESSGSMSQQELVRLTGLSAPTISVTLSQMELLGLVRRNADPKDMRLAHVRLTEQGQAASESMRSIVKSIETAAIAGFSPEELVLLTSYLQRVQKNLGFEEQTIEETV